VARTTGASLAAFEASESCRHLAEGRGTPGRSGNVGPEGRPARSSNGTSVLHGAASRFGSAAARDMTRSRRGGQRGVGTVTLIEAAVPRFYAPGSTGGVRGWRSGGVQESSDPVVLVCGVGGTMTSASHRHRRRFDR
jgi:hypothetical protein